MANKSPVGTAFRYSLILVLIAAVLELGKYFLELDQPLENDFLTTYGLHTLIAAISLAVVYMMVKRHRDRDRGGFLSIGNALVAGFLMSIFYGLMAVGWQFLFNSFFKKNMEEVTSEGKDTPEEDITFTNFLETNMNTESESFMILISSVATILLVSLLAGIILKRSPLKNQS